MNNFVDSFEIFSKSNLGSIRTITDKEGNPWFVTADICKVLDYKNPSDVTSRLDDYEHTTIKITKAQRDSLEGNSSNNNMLGLVTESGLYSIVLTSRKEEAKDFKRWLTQEVLPSIKNHGGYILHQEKLDAKDKEELAESITALYEKTSKQLARERRLHKSAVKERNELKEEKRELKEALKESIETGKARISKLSNYLNNTEELNEKLLREIAELSHKLEVAEGLVPPDDYKADDNPIEVFVSKDGFIINPYLMEEKDDIEY